MEDLVNLEEDLGGNGVEIEPLTWVRRSVWGMLYAGDTGTVPKLAEDLAKMMTAIVPVLKAAGLTVSENITEALLLRTLNQVLPTSPLVVEEAGQTYMQTTQFLYPGGLIDENADIMREIKLQIRQRSFQARVVRYGGCPVHV